MQESSDCRQEGDKMRVVVRIRPLLPKQLQEVNALEQQWDPTKKITRTKITQQALSFYTKYRNANPKEMIRPSHKVLSVYDQEYKNADRKMRDYHFNDVFDHRASNRDIYGRLMRDAVARTFQGFNTTVMAYGITGSGKTFTVFGHPKISKDKGLAYFAIQDMLQYKHNLEIMCKRVQIKFSFVQIYNQNVRDLLSEDFKKQVSVGEDRQGNVQLLEVREASINTVEQCVQLISLGSTRRASAATLHNQISSRSHAVLKLSIQVEDDRQRIQSKLFIIDLAGSQKINNASMARKQQGSNINKSLLTLGNCINALVESSRKQTAGHVPYRDSKLTRLLKDSLGGNAKMIMIACISPHPFSFQETVTTLNYAQRARGIKRQITRNSISTQQHCPKCHNQLSHSPMPSPFELEDKSCETNYRRCQTQMNNQRRCQTEVSLQGNQNINEIFQKLYTDLIQQAKQSQRLKSLRIQMKNSCAQLQVACRESEEQGQALRQLMENLLISRHNAVKNITQEQEFKPIQKKVIRLSSSRKKQRQYIDTYQENINSSQKKTYQVKEFIKMQGSSTLMPSVQVSNFTNSHKKQIQSQERRKELNSEQKMSLDRQESKEGLPVESLSLKRRRSKLQYSGRPPRQQSRTMSSEVLQHHLPKMF